MLNQRTKVNTVAPSQRLLKIACGMENVHMINANLKKPTKIIHIALPNIARRIHLINNAGILIASQANANIFQIKNVLQKFAQRIQISIIAQIHIVPFQSTKTSMVVHLQLIMTSVLGMLMIAHGNYVSPLTERKTNIVQKTSAKPILNIQAAGTKAQSP